MKKVLFLLLFFTISYAQQGIELRLINFSYQFDAGLNNIINSHNVFSFTPKSGHLYPVIQDRIFQIQGGDNTTTLLNDLINYNSVVESATIADASFFSDCCIAQILTASIGTPVGSNNGIVLTNDPGLNTIFQNFNVYYYTQAFPTSTWESNLRVYNIACNCNAAALIDVLENYDAVIDSVEVCSTYYLDVKDNNLSSLKIYPNPFSSEIKIDSKIKIKNYYLIDILGQLVVNTNSLQDLNSKLQTIKSGIYFIKLESDANVYETRKIVKL